MPTDDELISLLERAAADLRPDLTSVVVRSEQLGRKLRRRSRAVWTAAGSALAVLLAAGAGYAVSTWPSHGPASAGAPSANVSGDATASAKASSTASPRASQPQAQPSRPMTRLQMLRALRGMLPAAARFSHVATDTSAGSLEVDYNDGRGAVDVMVQISRFTTVAPSGGVKHGSSVLALSCPHPLWSDEGARPAGALPISCQLRTPAGGGTERDAVMYADEFGFYGYDIYYQRTDGVQVFIQVGNGYFDPYLPHVDRARPPGSMQLWESVADSQIWRA